MTDSSLHLDQDRKSARALARRLVEASILLRRSFSADACDGLQPHVVQVLLAIDLRPGATVGGLAERLSLSRPRTSTAVAQLLDRGLVEVQMGEGDGRRRPYVASSAGEAFVKRFVARVADG